MKGCFSTWSSHGLGPTFLLLFIYDLIVHCQVASLPLYWVSNTHTHNITNTQKQRKWGRAAIWNRLDRTCKGWFLGNVSRKNYLNGFLLHLENDDFPQPYLSSYNSTAHINTNTTLVFFFSWCYNEIPWKSNVRDKVVMWAHSMRVQSITARKFWQAWGIWSHCFRSQEAENDEYPCLASFFLFV